MLKVLITDFEVPEAIQEMAKEMVDAINKNPLIADCYESEMDDLLKCYDEDLDDEHINILRDYYVCGGIFND